MNLIPTVCPGCNQPLTIEKGKEKDGDVIKLCCKNKNCIGILIRKLQKGISSLKIRDIGPETIEKLAKSGLKYSYDLFNKNIINEENLIASGEFKKGRQLEKILTSINKVNEIKIEKAISSLQIDGIGDTFSKKIGQLFSGLNPDMGGQSKEIREKLKNTDSDIYLFIKESLENFEKNGITIKKFVPKAVVAEVKKLNKQVDATFDISEIINKLEWNLVDIKSNDCQMLIVQDKNEDNEKVKYAKDNAIKIMSLNQIKLLFL